MIFGRYGCGAEVLQRFVVQVFVAVTTILPFALAFASSIKVGTGKEQGNLCALDASQRNSIRTMTLLKLSQTPAALRQCNSGLDSGGLIEAITAAILIRVECFS